MGLALRANLATLSLANLAAASRHNARRTARLLVPPPAILLFDLLPGAAAVRTRRGRSPPQQDLAPAVPQW